MRQIREHAKDCLAIAPLPRPEGIAGRKKQRAPVTGDPARSPDAAAARPRMPADNIAGIVQIDADDPAAVVAAIAKMSAIRNIDAAREDD